MEREKRKIKKRRLSSRFKKLLIGIIVLVYFLSRIPSLFSQAGNTPYVAEYGKIENVASLQGYIVRDEEIIKRVDQGELTLHVSEGEKVARGEKLAVVHFHDLDEKAAKDLEIINLRIENIKEKNEETQIFNSDIVKIDEEIHKISKEIQDYIKAGKYEKIHSLKENMLVLTEKKSIIVGERSFSGRNLEQLERQQQSLKDKVNASMHTIYSQDPGYIALGSDGLEDLLSFTSIENINPEELGTITTSQNDDKDMNVIRIVKSHRWSIITEVKAEVIEALQEGRRMNLRPQGESREYKATVRKIISSEDEETGLVIMDLTEFMEGIYNKRTINFDLIINNYEGIILPGSTIVEKEGQVGVYRVDLNGFAKFVPVRVKGSNREYSILHNGFFEGKNEKDEIVRINTINFYDEIATNPSALKDGDRIR
ncbi:MAG: hypothetical protein JJT76_16135 [Clostridiaceae bacterium]|nr:hypothetical protein [Clostridiaceae bacterium]